MKFIPTELDGAFLLELEPQEDERGFFARSFCAREFESHGLSLGVVQSNVAFTYQKGTVRGLHYQASPAAETKLMRCTRGAIHDVIVDLRSESRTYLRYIAVELSAENRRGMFVPSRFGHGYQTLTNNTEVSYLVNEFYRSELERGLRYDDPALGIDWPLPVTSVSDKDTSWPLLEAASTVVRKKL
jgi:dTDP-4-dehydrorhamnose 3,5-epimerase